MRWPPAAFAGVLLLSLLVRCDCCPDEPTPAPSSGDRLSQSGYVGVGGSCRDDQTGDGVSGDYGCGASVPVSETCAAGLVCCPASDATGQYRCVASERCATSQPTEYCDGDRDCVWGYDCVSRRCVAPLGAMCWSGSECVTGYCNEDWECDYPPHDPWTPPDVGTSPDAGTGDQGAPVGDQGLDQAAVDQGAPEGGAGG